MDLIFNSTSSAGETRSDDTDSPVGPPKNSTKSSSQLTLKNNAKNVPSFANDNLMEGARDSPTSNYVNLSTLNGKGNNHNATKSQYYDTYEPDRNNR